MQQVFHETTALDDRSRLRWPRSVLRRVQQAFNRILDTLALWHFRATSRRELEQLEDRLLKDVGIDRSEAYKPFWRE